MGLFDRIKKAGGNIVSKAAQEVDIGGKSLDEWERTWEFHGILSKSDFSSLNNVAGVYRAKMHNEIVYIKAATKPDEGGLETLLTAYSSENASGEDEKAQKMHLMLKEHADKLEITTISTGKDDEAGLISKRMEGVLINKYKPKWNLSLF